MDQTAPPRLPISRVKARNCALLNQLGTPGLGSLLAGRWLAGAFQLLLAVAGFGLILAWFGVTLFRFYQMMESSSETTSAAPSWLGVSGGGLFILAWIWSLITSISIMRHAAAPTSSASPTD